jgi:hypothetical protein
MDMVIYPSTLGHADSLAPLVHDAYMKDNVCATRGTTCMPWALLICQRHLPVKRSDQSEVLRCAQDDKQRAQDGRLGADVCIPSPPACMRASLNAARVQSSYTHRLASSA